MTANIHEDLSEYAYWRARGLLQADAYLKVSPDVERRSASVIASRWEAHEAFAGFVAQHRRDYVEEIAAEEEKAKNRVINALEQIAFSSLEGLDEMLDQLSGGEVSLAALPFATKAAISSISFSSTDTGDKRSSKLSVGFHSKTTAMQLMMKRMGMLDGLSSHIAGLREYGFILSQDGSGNWSLQQDEFSGSISAAQPPASQQTIEAIPAAEDPD